MGDDDYSSGGERRNKGKDKKKRRRLFPYRHGGKFRANEINSGNKK
jgi:hypothetical protein